MSEVRITDAFSLRQNEVAYLYETQPENGRWFAVMAASVPPMPGKMKPLRDIPGMTPEPVELVCIIACQTIGDEYVWLQLAPDTKETIGDLLFNNNAEINKWYYVSIMAGASHDS